jgi:hypothetical protein
VSGERVRYQSDLEDSARWDGFVLRPGDIVISARSKTGTTWVQMICALLVFQTADLPAPLTTLSPWLDMKLRPVDEVHRQLTEQRHRRFIKTHTPLDGLPYDAGVTYVVTARDPRDMAVSLYHQSANLDRDRIRRLLDEPEPPAGTPPTVRRDARQALLNWIEDSGSPQESMDSLRGVMAHVSEAWERRQESNVVLVHYHDLSDDLDGEMRRLADELGVTVPERGWPGLVRAARFDSMRARADELVPDERIGLLRSNQRFFRSGESGQWRELLAPAEVARYDAKVTGLAPADLLEWLHR